MKYAKTLVATAFLAATGAAQAELTANVGAASNYYFRGITQTDDRAQVSGGIDWAHDLGFYLGTWMSNVDFGDDSKADVEVDLYGGFSNEIGDSGVGYDVGAIYYWYPGSGGNLQGGEIDYAEVYAGLSWAWLSGAIAYTVWGETDDDNQFDDGDIYYRASVEPDWEYKGFKANAFIGYYDFDADSSERDFNYTHWGIGITKDAGDFGAFSLNYEQVDDVNDANSDDNPNFWVGWRKEF